MDGVAYILRHQPLRSIQSHLDRLICIYEGGFIHPSLWPLQNAPMHLERWCPSCIGKLREKAYIGDEWSCRDLTYWVSLSNITHIFDVLRDDSGNLFGDPPINNVTLFLLLNPWQPRGGAHFQGMLGILLQGRRPLHTLNPCNGIFRRAFQDWRQPVILHFWYDVGVVVVETCLLHQSFHQPKMLKLELVGQIGWVCLSVGWSVGPMMISSSR